MDLFYPLPNQGTLPTDTELPAFVPKTRERQRGDIRVDFDAATRYDIRSQELSAPQSERHHV